MLWQSQATPTPIFPNPNTPTQTLSDVSGYIAPPSPTHSITTTPNPELVNTGQAACCLNQQTSLMQRPTDLSFARPNTPNPKVCPAATQNGATKTKP
jgi:hypothetical protein